MQFILRDETSLAAPIAGEIHIRPANADAHAHRALATLVITQGLAALQSGAEPFTQIIIPASGTQPTLDDMLAASLATKLIAGAELSSLSRYAPLARYAAMVREGLQPSDVPLEDSIEGIYLAIRSDGGVYVHEPANASRFLANWQRVEAVLLAACDNGADLLKTSLFNDNDFAREKTFLRRDQDVYRQDVARGRSLRAAIPGGPPNGSLLILDSPKSVLFKYWARRDNSSPSGDGYTLLGVHWGPGQWIFSTDPVQRLSLQDLAAALAHGEKENGTSVPSDPWFDGAAFDFTLVASPRAGSKLNDVRVLKILRDWARASTVPRPGASGVSSMLRHGLAIAAGLIVVIGLASLVARFAHRPAAPNAQLAIAENSTDDAQAAPENVVSRGSVQGLTPQQTDLLVHGTAGKVPGFAIIMGVGEPQEKSGLVGLDGACKGAVRFYRLLRDVYGYDKANIRLLVDRTDSAEFQNPDVHVDGPPTLQGFQNAVYQLRQMTVAFEQERQRDHPNDPTPSSQFIFYYGGHGVEDETTRDRAYLAFSGFDSTQAPDLTGLAMGDLYRYLRDRVDSPHQMIVLDCCLSGFGITSRGGDETPSNGVAPEWSKEAHAIITAGTAHQNSFDSNNQPFFTDVLCQGLIPQADGHCPADLDGNGIVTDEELAYYLKTTVRQQIKARNIGRSLTPQYWHSMDGDSGQFLMIPKNASGVN